MNMIAKIIVMELAWLAIFILLFAVIHAWRRNSGARRVVIMLISDITAAVIASYPLWN